MRTGCGLRLRALMLVLLLVAAPLARAATTAATETGELERASYRIDVPAHWNRELVVFFHGYATSPIVFRRGTRLSPMFEPILREGFAIIQSGYSRTGWAVEEGSADSERLRRLFVARHGKPLRTYAMGMSMGGTLTVMALESAPATYAGGLSLCGVIEPTDRMAQRDFALRAAFDYYYPGVLGPLVPVDPAFHPDRATVARVSAAMAADPKGFDALRALYGAGDRQSLPDVITFISYEIAELQRRTGGNPFGNADLVYAGPADADALNDGVRRYRAEPKAAAYLARWYTPSGRLSRPLLALHDTRDPLVIPATAFEYALLAQRAGHADKFVQQYVKAEGHCVFTAQQIGQAFDELVTWARDGKRPAPGLQHDPSRPGP